MLARIGVPSCTRSSLASSRASSSATARCPARPGPRAARAAGCWGRTRRCRLGPCSANSATHRDTAAASSNSASTTIPGLSTRVTSRRTSLPGDDLADLVPDGDAVTGVEQLADVAARPPGAAPRTSAGGRQRRTRAPVSARPRIGAAVSRVRSRTSRRSRRAGPARSTSGSSALTARYSRRIGVSPAESRSSVAPGRLRLRRGEVRSPNFRACSHAAAPTGSHLQLPRGRLDDRAPPQLTGAPRSDGKPRDLVLAGSAVRAAVRRDALDKDLDRAHRRTRRCVLLRSRAAARADG